MLAIINAIISYSAPAEEPCVIIPRLSNYEVFYEVFDRNNNKRELFRRKLSASTFAGEKEVQRINLTVSVSPSGHHLFLPSIRTSSKLKTVGGTVLSDNGNVSLLPEISFPVNRGYTCVGWEAENPTIIEFFWTDTNDTSAFNKFQIVNGGWKLLPGSKAQEGLAVLVNEALWLNGFGTATFMSFSDNWQGASYLRAGVDVLWNPKPLFRTIGRYGEVLVLDRSLLALGINHKHRSLQLSEPTDIALPDGHGFVYVRRVSTKLTPVGKQLLKPDEGDDPFLESKVYRVDLASGREEFVSEGLYGLPLPSKWLNTAKGMKPN